jgi:hypothetical protein
MSNEAKRGLRFVLTSVIAFAIAVPAFAQRTTGTLRGIVQDPQTAVIAGASVTATNDATNVANTTVTKCAPRDLHRESGSKGVPHDNPKSKRD